VTASPDASTPRSVTFAEIGANARRLAHGLSELGVGPGTRVCTLMWNNPEHVTACLAIPAMGAVAHPIDVRMYSEQVAHAVNHASDRVAIVDHDLLPDFAKLLPRLKTVEHVIINGEADLSVLEGTGVGVLTCADVQAAHEPSFEWPQLAETEAALLCDTLDRGSYRGTVAYSHRSTYLHALAAALPDAMGLVAGDRILVAGAQLHAWTWGLPYAAFLAGTSLVLPHRFASAADIAEVIGSTAPTKAIGPAPIWEGFGAHLAEHPDTDLDSLGEIVTDRSVALQELEGRLAERDVQITRAWMSASSGPIGLYARPPAWSTGDQRDSYRNLDGRLVGLVEARVLGPQGDVLPWDGESTGELEVRGPWIAESLYLEDEDLAHGGWLRTGELAAITSEGYVRLSR
jgi:fatty-acyl-CoA synthase